MPTWINANEAAHKYGVSLYDIRFWADNKEIGFIRKGRTFIVDDESIQEMLSQYEILPTRELFETQRQLCENQVVLCEAYAELIEVQNIEMERMRSEISLLEKINNAREKQTQSLLEITRKSH